MSCRSPVVAAFAALARRSFIGAALLATVTSSAHSSTAVVPDDYATIQAAVDAADTVFVRPGDYPEKPRLDAGRPVRLLRSHPSDDSPRPSLAGLAIHATGPTRLDRLIGLAFTGPVELETDGGGHQLFIERCRLDSGLVQTLSGGTYGRDRLSITGSVVQGDVTGTFETGHFAADTIRGHVATAGESGLEVYDSIVEGSGGTGIRYMDDGTVRVANTRISGFDVGVQASSQDGRADVQNSVIVSCGTAISVASGYVVAIGNELSYCRIGIHCDGENLTVIGNRIGPGEIGVQSTAANARIEGNTIVRCTTAAVWCLSYHKDYAVVTSNDVRECGDGLVIRAAESQIRYNRVIGCAGDGIVVTSPDYPLAVDHNVSGRNGRHGFDMWSDNGGAVANNTSYLNAEHGLQISMSDKGPSSITANIAYANGGQGFHLFGGDEYVSVSCNDAHANTGGPGIDLAPNNLDLDPVFCDLASDSVSLRFDSPLIGVSSCPLIGALEPGCGSPPTPFTTLRPTSCDARGWVAHAGGGDSVAISGAFPHPTGSLHLLASSGSSITFVRALSTPERLADLTQLAADFYRTAGSSAAAHVAPRVRLLIDNGATSARFSYLIWEAADNGFSDYPIDTWIPHAMATGYFWQQALDPDRRIDVHDRRLADWLQPGTIVDGDGDVSNEIGPDARVVGYEIEVATEGPGAFEGAADRFRVAFGDRDTLFDFERSQISAIVLSALPGTACGALVLDAFVTPNGIPGEVEFFDGNVRLGAATPSAVGRARLTVTGLAAGPHRLIASMGPSPCAAADTLEREVPAVTTSVSLTSSRLPAKLGDRLVFTARIAPAIGAGTVEFFDGTVSLGTASLSAGTASLEVVLAEGSHPITAGYGGDGCNLPSTSAVLEQVVGAPPLLSIGDTNALESSGVMVFTVSLSSFSTVPVTVDYATADSTATVADQDYEATQGTLTIPPGQTSGTVAIDLIPDTRAEGFEMLHLVLSRPTIATLGDSLGRGLIRESALPQIVIPVVVNIEEQDLDTTWVDLPVTLTSSWPWPVTVEYATSAGSAQEGADYAATRGTLRFPPMERSGTIHVGIVADSTRENRENFHVTLSDAIGLSIAGAGSCDVRILNDDPIPTIRVDDATVLEENSGTRVFAYPVRLSNRDAINTVKVYYASVENTARQYQDYEPVYGSLQIPPLSPEGYVLVPIRGDLDCEPDESFVLVFSQAVNGLLPDVLASVTVQDDDCATATLVTQFHAAASSEGVELTWRLGTDAARATLERATAILGPWTVAAAETRDEAGIIVALDRTAESGRSYWYRLAIETATGARVEYGPVEVTAGRRVTRFGLGPLMPNPSLGPTRIEYWVATEANVHLSLLDLQGRELAILAEGLHRPGIHVAAWNGESERGLLPPGLYFVRYRAGGGTWSRRLIVTR